MISMVMVSQPVMVIAMMKIPCWGSTILMVMVGDDVTPVSVLSLSLLTFGKMDGLDRVTLVVEGVEWGSIVHQEQGN